MNKNQMMKKLGALGTAQNRKVYGRHVTSEMFGVSFANLGMLKREVKVDQELAEQLWATGNLDAQILATMIADPEQMTASKLDAWVKEADNRGTGSALSNLAAKSPVAFKRVEKWTRSRNEWISMTGWHVLASLAREDEERSDDVLEGYLGRIEAEIHGAKNYTRYAMNNALISIGISNPKLRKMAIAAARRIGKVEVDHGPTSCKTPDAVPYIAKAVAHQAKQAQKKKAKKKKAQQRATAGAS